MAKAFGEIEASGEAATPIGATFQRWQATFSEHRIEFVAGGLGFEMLGPR
jgi:hypothetical protein